MGLGVPNHFETAFAAWLGENRLTFVPVDQAKRAAFARCNIKSFDFLIYPRCCGKDVLLAEVKGRRFEGSSLERLTGLPCWVTMEDIRGLMKWEDIFGPGYKGYFIFAYEIAKPDVDLDRFRSFEFGDRRYVYLCIAAEEYSKAMRSRSARWQTVTLGAEDFRRCAVEIEKLVF